MTLSELVYLSIYLSYANLQAELINLKVYLDILESYLLQ